MAKTLEPLTEAEIEELTRWLSKAERHRTFELRELDRGYVIIRKLLAERTAREESDRLRYEALCFMCVALDPEQENEWEYTDIRWRGLIDTLLAEREADKAEVERFRKLLVRLSDDDVCRYDHHGYCQTHRLEPKPCPMEEVNRIAAAAAGGE